MKTLQDIAYKLLDYKNPVDPGFSAGKSLWVFQTEALHHATSLLRRYYSDPSLEETERKAELLKLYEEGNIDLSRLDVEVKLGKRNREILDILQECEMLEDGRVPFGRICNRMGFWMATGSGKTLVIVKLIEYLARMMDEGAIPRKDILILSHKDHLLQQIRSHTDEYNGYRPYKRIIVEDLRSYGQLKNQSSMLRDNEITVFAYRSDLFKLEQKQKGIDFRLYDNDGNWYVILDEAHRGEASDSVRKHIFNLLSRNGFLFNFSATFVESLDITTTIYNFNLAEFIIQGYGKHIVQMQEDTSAFSKSRSAKDFDEEEKRKIVLKSLILLAYAKKCRVRLPLTYHSPLLVVFAHTVAEPDADLELFFNELVKLGRGQIEPEAFNTARAELTEELRCATYQFEGGEAKLDLSLLESMSLQDIYTYVFNAEGPGKTEVVIPRSDDKFIQGELAFQLDTATEPYACIKISATDKWLKGKLDEFPKSETYLPKSYFASLNEPDSPVNILLGAFSFYEGWDSNRPNVIMYVNIGTGDKAKKFILQSMGRGVRVSPSGGMMGRIERYHDGIIAKDPDTLKRLSVLETLFVFAASRKNLSTILEVMDSFSQKRKWKPLPSIKRDTQGYTLFIPKYSSTETPIVDHTSVRKFVLRDRDKRLLESYIRYIGSEDRILWAHCGYEPKDTGLLRRFLESPTDYFLVDSGARPHKSAQSLLVSLKQHFSQKLKDVESPKLLEDEIIHYRHIQVSAEMYDKVKPIHDMVIKSLELDEAIEKGDSEKARELNRQRPDPHVAVDDVNLRYLSEHYYCPLVYSSSTKDWFRHIVCGKSEFQFIQDLAETRPNFDCDWWLFSRIDEHLDRVYIPYYDRDTNQMREFYPDFVFWFGTGDEVTVVFVDPKGPVHADYEYKVDGYRILFEEDGVPKTFIHPKTGKKVRFLLKLYTKDANRIASGYRSYWIDDPSKVPL